MSVKNNLPEHAQEIYKEAFNHADECYGERSKAFRVAWGAVKRTYEKDEQGNCVHKKD